MTRRFTGESYGKPAARAARSGGVMALDIARDEEEAVAVYRRNTARRNEEIRAARELSEYQRQRGTLPYVAWLHRPIPKSLMRLG